MTSSLTSKNGALRLDEGVIFYVGGGASIRLTQEMNPFFVVPAGTLATQTKINYKMEIKSIVAATRWRIAGSDRVRAARRSCFPPPGG